MNIICNIYALVLIYALPVCRHFYCFPVTELFRSIIGMLDPFVLLALQILPRRNNNPKA